MNTGKIRPPIPERDAAKRNRKRVMTLGSKYAERNYTVNCLQEAKGKRILVETLVFDPEVASAAEVAGIDTLKVPFDPAIPEPAIALRNAAPHTFMAFSIPLTLAATSAKRYEFG